MSIEEVSNDKRGNMIKITWNDVIYWIAYTKKGFGRGGESHPIVQYNTIISGKIMVRMIIDGEDITKILSVGQSVTIPPNVPHVAITLENSVVMEWHDGKLPPFEQKVIYEPYRKLIWGK